MEIAVTRDLAPEVAQDVRALLDAAFGPTFTDHDWDHCLGGHHVLVSDGGSFVAHAAVVPRVLRVSDEPYGAGYVEGVATHPSWRRRGAGTLAMRAVADLVREHHAFGALSTSSHGFYERLGWERWRGRTFVRAGDTTVRTVEEDDGILVLRHRVPVDLTADLACEARPGDDW